MSFFKFYCNKWMTTDFHPGLTGKERSLVNAGVWFSLCSRPKHPHHWMILLYLKSVRAELALWFTSVLPILRAEWLCPLLSLPVFPLLASSPAQAKPPALGFSSPFLRQFPYGKNWTWARSQQRQWKALPATWSPDLQCRKNKRLAEQCPSRKAAGRGGAKISTYLGFRR